MSIQAGASDEKGRPYSLLPIEGQVSGSFQGMPEYDYPSLEQTIEDSDRQLAIIRRYEDQEGAPRKAIRKVIDWSLSGSGTITAGAVAAYEVYSHHVGGSNHAFEWVNTIGAGIGGIMVHEFFRRPVVGIRGFYHHWRNPFSPAAQSNERIRQDILET
jgi:hypothetical protein